MREIVMLELANLASHYTKLYKETGFGGISNGKVMLTEKAFKETFDKWEVEDLNKECNVLVAEMYDTKFIAIVDKEKNES